MIYSNADIIDIVHKYLDIPYDTCDCIKLAYLILRNVGVVVDGAEKYFDIDPDWINREPDLMDRFMVNLGMIVESPQPFDIVMFSIYQDIHVDHVGIYVGDGKFVHTMNGVNSRISRLTSPYWRVRFKGIRRVGV